VWEGPISNGDRVAPFFSCTQLALGDDRRMGPRNGHLLERVAVEDCDWAGIASLPQSTVFHTREWLEFLRRTQGAEPVVARVVSPAGEALGYFMGGVVRRYGVPILGSPFPGWTTGPMGFTLTAPADRRALLPALSRFALRELRCLHLEMMDRRLGWADLPGRGFQAGTFHSFELDLTRTEDDLFGGMTSACRRAVRKATKSGVALEEASGDSFAEEYHAQLEDVFAKQFLSPTYGVDRVRELIRCLEPTGRLLLLRARDPEGRSIATAIFLCHGRLAWFWGGASWREHQILRPNDAIFWQAIRRCKERGAQVLDMGGGGEYKRKFGVTELELPFLRRSHVPGLMLMRNVAARAYAQRRAISARARRRAP
jgi:CelD/BcsL family acetyltransferase involved in cellulose biosynthesis